MVPTYELISFGVLLLRLTLGIIFFAHGTQKVFSWFGGHGPKGTYGYFTETLKIPSWLAYIGVYAEPIASTLLILGFLTKLAALAMSVQMLVALFVAHREFGFFMNFGRVGGKGEGYEYTMSVAIMCLVVFLLGGGAYSLDALL